MPGDTYWIKQATTDEGTVREWWQRWPDANIGILAGRASGVLVVDIDNRHGGAESLEQLEAECGPLPKTQAVQTGDGRHIYFQYADLGLRSSTTLAPGVELRADGGGVTAPGSRHASGCDYQWVEGAGPDVPLAAFPANLLRARQAVTEAPADTASRLTDGHRNVLLTSMAGALRSRGATADAIDAALQGINERDGAPPLPPDEVRQIATSVGRYEPGLTGLTAGTSALAAETMPRRYDLLSVADLFKVPKTAWLVKELVETSTLGIIYGPSGEGKTFVALDVALSVATGRAWHDHAVQRGPVAYVVAEGSRGIAKRVQAWMDQHDEANVSNAFFLLSDVQLLVPGDVGGLIEAIATTCPRPALVLLDTFSQCFVGGEENSASEVGVALAAARRIVQATGAAVLPVHHTGKLRPNSERGSSALRGNVDIMVSVSMDKDRVVTVKQTKAKNHEPMRPLRLKLTQVEVGTEDDGEPVTSCVLGATGPANRNDGSGTHPDANDSEQRAYDVLATFGDKGTRSGVWRKAIETSQRVAVPPKTFNNWRASLVAKGLVEEVPGQPSTYRVVGAGVECANGTPDGMP